MPYEFTIVAPPLCECGCGKTPRLGSRFLAGHNQRLKAQPPVTKVCLYCSVEFLVPSYFAQRGVGKYCSQSHAMLARHSRVTIEERFWPKVDKNGPIPAHRPDLGPCWLWTGATNEWGYGIMERKRRTVLAHRVAYELQLGPIPEGLLVCHHCDNPPCQRDSHFFTGTDQHNSDDKIKKGRAWFNKPSAGA